MRCQKVRSYLSAYCNDELSGDKKLALDTHLAGCAACRKEEAVFRLLHESKDEMPVMKVSADFNNQLLNRIGQERFAETRTKAYLPTNAPIFLWKKVAPAFVSVCLLIVTAVALISSQNGLHTGPLNFTQQNTSDAYLYAQPTNNPNVTTKLDDNWSFNEQLARSERINTISRDVSNSSAFMHNVAFKTSATSGRTPYLPDHRQMQPVMRIYIIPHPPIGKGGSGEY